MNASTYLRRLIPTVAIGVMTIGIGIMLAVGEWWQMRRGAR